jgi:hypothetical protein
MPTLQLSGRIALAQAIAVQSLHIAWGRGSAAWDTTPVPEPTTATALVDEIARRTVNSVGYVTPDAAGEIIMPSGDRFTASAQPTNILNLYTEFAFADAAGETVREYGLFIGSVATAGLPAGQRYFTPAQLANPGKLYALERVPHFVRNGAVAQVYRFLLPTTASMRPETSNRTCFAPTASSSLPS